MKPSVINPFTLVKDDLTPLLILITRKKEHVLLPKPNSFKELIPILHDAFNIDKSTKVTYYITSCALCPGEKVRVLSPVLEMKNVWQILDHLVIEVPGDREDPPPSSSQREAQSQTQAFDSHPSTPRVPHKHKTRRTTQVISRKLARPRSSIAIDEQDVEANEPSTSQQTPTVTVKKERTPNTTGNAPPSSSRRRSVSTHHTHKTKSEPQVNAPAEVSSQDRQPPQPSRTAPIATSQEDEVANTTVVAQTNVNSNERFNFLVIHEASGKEQHFRGRGTYSVQKVLEKVCDVLDIDSNTAQMFQYVDLDGSEGGDLSSKNAIPLEGTSTLAECGITENSVLMISEDPDDEESEA